MDIEKVRMLAHESVYWMNINAFRPHNPEIT